MDDFDFFGLCASLIPESEGMGLEIPVMATYDMRFNVLNCGIVDKNLVVSSGHFVHCQNVAFFGDGRG